jgi:hypothetical protein
VPSTAGGEPGQRVKAVFVPPPEPVEPAAGPAASPNDAPPAPAPPKAAK